MINFYVGQEIVCVDNGQPKDTTLPSELTVGNVYVVRWIGPYNHYLDGEYIGVRLVGIDRGICSIWGYDDPPFKAKRFRPVDKIGFLRHLAANQNMPIDAPEGPLRPDGPLPEHKREKEEV